MCSPFCGSSARNVTYKAPLRLQLSSKWTKATETVDHRRVDRNAPSSTLHKHTGLEADPPSVRTEGTILRT